MARGLLGFLEISLGNDAAAMPHVQPLLDWLAQTNLALAPHPTAPYALEALIACGYLEQARALTARFEREADQLDGPWMLMIAARCRGLIAAAEGELAAALDAFDDALACDREERWPFEHARTLLARRRVQRRAKQKGEARRSLERALAIFDALPAPLWSERTRAELARIGLRTSAANRLALKPKFL
jgi:tetratricopeptide (TPR) repeat protein